MNIYKNKTYKYTKSILESKWISNYKNFNLFILNLKFTNKMANSMKGKWYKCLLILKIRVS